MDSTALQSTEELMKMLQKFGARFLIDILFITGIINEVICFLHFSFSTLLFS
jgi:hypothetical protein